MPVQFEPIIADDADRILHDCYQSRWDAPARCREPDREADPMCDGCKAQNSQSCERRDDGE